MKRRSLAMIGMAMMTPAAGGYELGTHAFVSKVAFDASVLSPSNAKTVVPILGFDRLSETMPFSGFDLTATPLNRYWDDAPTGQVELETVIGSILRAPQNEEGKIFERLIASTYLPSTSRADFELRADAWVMRGAVREDDNDIGTLYSIGDRDADPRHTVFRAGRHFYDPVNERALTDGVTCFFFGCIRATEWAMGRSGVLDGPGTITADRENHYSWHDARNNYWWALTAKPALATTYGEMQRLNSGNRSMRWATTLKSVGQVIHLVQDMAQPQHTRNDSHGPPIAGLLSFSSRSDGTFEAYTEARLFLGLPPGGFESPFTHFDGNKLTSDNLPGLQLRTSSPYLTPSFSTPVEFFTTRESDESITARRGLSDVSNRGFFTSSTLPVNVTTGIPAQGPTAYLDPPNPDGSAFYEELPLETSLYADGSVVRMYQLVAPMPDVLDPNWNNQSGLFDDYSADGRMPLLAASQTRLGSDLIGSPTPETDSTKYTISYEVFTAMADAMLPRAVGYSTGLINFFFRGRLEVTPTAQNAFAVLNQGEPHTVDAEGYPRKPGGGIFGFEKVRLKVRNVSESITESGPATPAIPQTSGSGTLVAVARYHRNACYKPDMSGERVIAYAAPPTIGAITEPTCTAALPARTAYQEISVSAPIAISSSAGLPGGVGTGGNAPAAIEKLFDFSADPIPVNATDLFIQVVYRGQLGDEPDGIAVGTYDAREPTFVGIYNNTDYYWNVTMSEPPGWW